MALSMVRADYDDEVRGLKPGPRAIKQAERLLRSECLEEYRKQGKDGLETAAYYEAAIKQKLSNFYALDGNFNKALTYIKECLALLSRMSSRDARNMIAAAGYDLALTLFLKGDREKGLKEMLRVPTDRYWPSRELVAVITARMTLELGRIDDGIRALDKAITLVKYDKKIRDKEKLDDILDAVEDDRAVPRALRLTAEDLIHT